ncbi:glycosyltransferase family 2 protein [Rhodovulum visakhapatnamense]|uniref:Glycosyltransferase 2-like domain-containing protein n=1 Tax=Rhodovulum visakhapatnamense TaxID=364297 RepID=A0A4R8F9K5_9RHOB|nr:glycosyltransferase family 2 protein [Rhodovulum visakhapatnamense]TDX22226.1 hypothetical protein EV657_1318 [Rhodovulum visakhapatnamense]
MNSIAVIIVNYNAAGLAIEGVESVRARTHGGRTVEIHLVDNASPDGSAEILQRAHADRGWGREVTLYLEAENHGFGRGNNIVLETLAARTDPPDYVFLLNPDARLENETLAILADFLDAHPGAAFAGASVTNPGAEAPVPASAAFRFPSLPATFGAAVNFGPITRLFARWTVALPADIPTRRVDWVSGAGVMARRHVFQETGNFDPYYFLYFEEVDLMRACVEAGWEGWYVAEARILHVEGASTDVQSRTAAQRPRKPAYWYDSWQHYFVKAHGRPYALATGLAWILGASMNHAITRLRGRTPIAPAHFFRDFWAMGLRPVLGLKQEPY